MLETMLALKNNDMRKIPGYDPEPVERLRKLQRTLVGHWKIFLHMIPFIHTQQQITRNLSFPYYTLYTVCTTLDHKMALENSFSRGRPYCSSLPFYLTLSTCYFFFTHACFSYSFMVHDSWLLILVVNF